MWIGNLKPRTRYNLKLVSSAECGGVKMGEQTLLVLPYGELIRQYSVDSVRLCQFAFN